MASRDADRAAVEMYGREVGRPKNGKARMIGLPRWLRDALAEHLTRPAPGAGPEHTVFDTAGGHALYHTVFMRRVFGPAEAALPTEKQGLRFHDLRHTRATLLIAAGAHAISYTSGSGTPASPRRSTCTGTCCPAPTPPSSMRSTRISEQCDEGDDAAAARGS